MADLCPVCEFPVNDGTLPRPRGPTREYHVEPDCHPGSASAPDHRLARDRGLHSTLAVDSGITSHAVAAALGHESFKTTAESYAQREAVVGAQQRRVLGVLAGGKLAS
jgi:hypothetical protein